MSHLALILAAASLIATPPLPGDPVRAAPAVATAAADTVAPQVRDPRGLRREIDRRYPGELFAEGVSGTAVLRVSVSPTGRAEVVSVDRSSGHPRLDEAAASAVRAVRFIPAAHRGEPVPAVLRIPITLHPPAPGEHAAGDRLAPPRDPDAEGGGDARDGRAEAVERHRLAAGAFERAQVSYREALQELQQVGERWTPLRAALQEAEAALEAAHETEETVDEETLRVLEEAVARYRAELEPLEPLVTRSRARVQLALEDVRERAAMLREAEAELRGVQPEDTP